MRGSSRSARKGRQDGANSEIFGLSIALRTQGAAWYTWLKSADFLLRDGLFDMTAAMERGETLIVASTLVELADFALGYLATDAAQLARHVETVALGGHKGVSPAESRKTLARYRAHMGTAALSVASINRKMGELVEILDEAFPAAEQAIREAESAYAHTYQLPSSTNENNE